MYGKIFESMYDGTLADNWEAMVTFQQLIVLATADGIVDMTPSAISRRTGIPKEIIQNGLEVLESPDECSRTSDMDGKRICRLDEHRDWGWFIVNHQKYRDISSSKEKRERDAERKRVARSSVQDCPRASDDVHARPLVSEPVRARPQNSTHTDTDTDTEANTDNKAPTARISSAIDEGFEAFWNVVHRKEGKKAAKKQFKAAVVSVRKDHGCTEIQAIGYLITRMKAFAKSPQARDEVKGTLHPATWLSQGRYDDDDSVWRGGEGAKVDDYAQQWRAKLKRNNDGPVSIGSLLDESA